MEANEESNEGRQVEQMNQLHNTCSFIFCTVHKTPHKQCVSPEISYSSVKALLRRDMSKKMS